MKIAANIIWLVFAGIWLFLGYVVSGILNCLFIITIPFGLQAFKLAGFALWPFGRTAVARPGASAAGSGCGNILWFVLGGWYMALLHFITGLLLCIFIITIPSQSRTSSLLVSHLRRSGRRSSATPKHSAGGPTTTLARLPAGNPHQPRHRLGRAPTRTTSPSRPRTPERATKSKLEASTRALGFQEERYLLVAPTVGARRPIAVAQWSAAPR